MPYESMPHILSADDVLPAEGAQDAADTANLAVQTFYVQHDQGDRHAHHVDYPFLIGRFHVRLPEAGGQDVDRSRLLTVVAQVGAVHSVVWAPWQPEPGGGFRDQITCYIDPAYVATGINVMTRCTETPVTMARVRPLRIQGGSVTPSGITGLGPTFTTFSIMFPSQTRSDTVTGVSCLIRGKRVA